MKNISFILHFVLIVAVGILYYLHFSESKAAVHTQSQTADTTVAVAMAEPGSIKSSNIVYVNIDSLSENYLFFKDLKKDLESERSVLEKQYGIKAKELQDFYMENQQKASQGLLTPDQAKLLEEDMLKRKSKLDEMEMKLNELTERAQQKNADALKEVIKFLEDYNRNGAYNYVLTYSENGGGSVLFANDSLNITKEVLQGLNTMYRQNKAKNKK